MTRPRTGTPTEPAPQEFVTFGNPIRRILTNSYHRFIRQHTNRSIHQSPRRRSGASRRRSANTCPRSRQQSASASP